MLVSCILRGCFTEKIETIFVEINFSIIMNTHQCALGKWAVPKVKDWNRETTF